jgi:membrane-bound metal-dependent hydrolase YbcI (DUF457 family)
MTHLLTGIAIGSLMSMLSPQAALSLMAIGAAFGVLPDIDILFSGLGKRVHRSPATHSILASSIMALIWLLLVVPAAQILDPNPLSGVPLLPSTAVAFAASFLHSAEDSLSVYGCRLFYPLSRRIIRGQVKYNDWATNGLLSFVAIAAIAASQVICRGLV